MRKGNAKTRKLALVMTMLVLPQCLQGCILGGLLGGAASLVGGAARGAVGILGAGVRGVGGLLFGDQVGSAPLATSISGALPGATGAR